jgi:hypothetical protein
MNPLTQADCLVLWESGRTLHPIDQGLLAVQTAFPETRHESVADWPLGRRNRALVQIHCASFGPLLSGWTACRQCGEKLEFEVDANALTEAAPEQPHEAPVSVAGCNFRLPTSRDLAALATLAASPDPTPDAPPLLQQCLLAAPGTDSETTAIPAWTPADLEAIEERLALSDPLAEILLQFDCPVCGESFHEPLDLATFIWSELEARARHLLLDVHTLASAYGWSEPEILALSPARRAAYLDMVVA